MDKVDLSPPTRVARPVCEMSIAHCFVASDRGIQANSALEVFSVLAETASVQVDVFRGL